MKTEQVAQHTPGMKVQIVGGHYAVVDHNGNFYAKTYSSTDARLIAAAPELLTACKRLLSLTDDPNVQALAARFIQVRDIIKSAQATVEKATQP